MIIDIGLTDYEAAYVFQKELVSKRKLGRIRDSLIITEHRAVFTMGRQGRERDLVIGRDRLEARGLSVIDVDRGGGVTFHGPGQLILYPVVDLRMRNSDMHRYLRDLESVAICFLNGYGIMADRIQGRTGVWVGGAKIASIGVGASSWVTYHGMSLNVDVDLSFFSMINTCGMTDIQVTSLSGVLGSNVSMCKAKDNLIACFKRIFSVEDKLLEAAPAAVIT
jgi:lipoic acid synthetase/lipoyl(octanoyl) transferase